MTVKWNLINDFIINLLLKIEAVNYLLENEWIDWVIIWNLNVKVYI